MERRDESVGGGGKPLFSDSRAALALLVGALLTFLAFAAPAESYIYWTGEEITIGRANLDGSGMDSKFITAANYPGDVEVDQRHLYWTNGGDGTIGRADIDGSAPDPAFVTAATGLWGIAVDADHIYWTDFTDETIGRAKIDGSGADPVFITGVTDPTGIAVDGRHIYTASAVNDTIGRARLDGSTVYPGFLTGVANPLDVAVDAEHIYWTSASSDMLGRARLDGSGVEQGFITGADSPWGIAVHGGHIYWSNENDDTIGRAELDGSAVDQAFVAWAPSFPGGIAVDGRGPQSAVDRHVRGSASAKQTQKQNGKKIVVKARVRTKEDLDAKVTGKVEVRRRSYKLKPVTESVSSGSSKNLKLKPTKSKDAKEIAEALKRGKKARAKLTVKLSDEAGNKKAEELSVKLKR